MTSQGGYSVSTDPALIDLDAVHAYLATSYWSPGIPRDFVERAIRHSLCFGLYRDRPEAKPEQVGFARVVTDRATFAYLADVFILEPHRGRGLSKLLMRTILAHPDLQNLRRFMLLTRDAHALYERFGFTPCADPARVMEKRDPDVYQRLARRASLGES